MTTYIIFLRGINVGGHKKVPMAELKKMFAHMGCENIQTFLNSGNILLDMETEKEGSLVKKISAELEKTFGFRVNVILRPAETIQGLLDLNPFEKIKTDKDTRLYVSFLPEKSKSNLKLPYLSSKKDFKILQKTDREIFSMLDLKTARSVDAMAFLEKEYGKYSTTRNWNTIVKIGSYFQN